MLRAKQRFDDGVQRVRNIDSLYVHLVTNLHLPEIDVSDILRSEIVYVISSFDKFIHDVVKQGMLEIFIGSRVATSAYKNFNISLEQSIAIMNSSSLPPPETIFENMISTNHKHLSFQEPENVAQALSLIWPENHKWQKIALCMGMPEPDVRIELKNIVIRRNQIVHEADIDLMTNQIQNIRHQDVEESVNFVEKIGNCIFSLL